MTRIKRIAKWIVTPIVLLTLIAAGDQYYEISKHIDIFVSVYKEIDEQYVDEVNHAKLMRKAIDGMLSDLDPYTVFYSESEVEDYKFQQTGKYGGIGANVGKRNGYFTLLEVYKGFAADKAGLLAGDKILNIDGKDVTAKSVKDLSPFLKGEPNTEITLTYERYGESNPLTVTFKREEVKIDNVTYAQMLDENVGYVKFTNFRQNGAADVKAHLEKFKQEGMNSLILDLRGNPGGLLIEAVAMVNLFVGRKKVVVETKGKNLRNNQTYTTQTEAYDKDIPVVILIDENSASASEIVSGALQDYDRAVVVGNTSFGKGLVQNILPLTYNTQVKVTTAKYYIPSGRCIQRLDYASKGENGKASAFPDSLKREFKTENGRKVYDGAGVDPDIVVEDIEQDEIVNALINQYLIFDFATKFRLENDSITGPSKFEVTDAIFNDFKAYADSRNLKFETKAEKALEKLKEYAIDNGMIDHLQTDITNLEQKMNQAKREAFSVHKDEIKKILKLEIIARYYYREGRAEAALIGDADMDKAFYLLQNPKEYNEVLSPK